MGHPSAYYHTSSSFLSFLCNCQAKVVLFNFHHVKQLQMVGE